jgi:hypothetical protein
MATLSLDLLKVVLVAAEISTAGLSFAQDRPLTDDEKKIVASTYQERLQDPLSAQFRWHNFVKSPSENSDDSIYCFQVNAKNSYGGYVGFKTMFGTVTQRDGTIVGYRYKLGAESNPIMNEAATEFCEVAGYKFQ